MQQTPTYVPALFGNALVLSNNNIERVIAKILPVYNQILQEYNGNDCAAVLSFNELSAMQHVKHLLQGKGAASFVFKADGSVMMVRKS